MNKCTRVIAVLTVGTVSIYGMDINDPAYQYGKFGQRIADAFKEAYVSCGGQEKALESVSKLYDKQSSQEDWDSLFVAPSKKLVQQIVGWGQFGSLTSAELAYTLSDTCVVHDEPLARESKLVYLFLMDDGIAQTIGDTRKAALFELQLMRYAFENAGELLIQVMDKMSHAVYALESDPLQRKFVDKSLPLDMLKAMTDQWSNMCSQDVVSCAGSDDSPTYDRAEMREKPDEIHKDYGVSDDEDMLTASACTIS